MFGILGSRWLVYHSVCLNFELPNVMFSKWQVGLTNLCPLGILAGYGRLLDVPTWPLQGAQALSQSPFGSVTTAAWLQQGVSSSADTRHRWENNAGTFQIGKPIDFTLWFLGLAELATSLTGYWKIMCIEERWNNRLFHTNCWGEKCWGT